MRTVSVCAPHFQPDPEPTDADRAWWAEQNTEWHDQDARPPHFDMRVRIGGGWRLVRVDLRDIDEPERFEHLAI